MEHAIDLVSEKEVGRIGILLSSDNYHNRDHLYTSLGDNNNIGIQNILALDSTNQKGVVTAAQFRSCAGTALKYGSTFGSTLSSNAAQLVHTAERAMRGEQGGPEVVRSGLSAVEVSISKDPKEIIRGR